MKRFICMVLLLIGFNFTANSTLAAPDLSMFNSVPGGEAMAELTLNIYDIAQQIHESTAEMMKIGNMVLCNSLHGKAAEWKFSVLGFFELSLGRVISFDLFLAGILLYILGFMVMLLSSYYMFDVAFNLAIAIAILPIALSLWLFGWTKDKLKKVIESITFYTGLFIFLPLGILLSKEIVMAVINGIIDRNTDLEQLFREDNADAIQDLFGVFTMSLLKITVCFILAFKIIPTMADEFCKHFFGKPAGGNPLKDKIKQIVDITKKKIKGKMGKYFGDVMKNSAGKGLENYINATATDSNGNHKPNLMERSIARYAQGLANTGGKG